MQVIVKFNNIEFALRYLKRKVQREGIPRVLRTKRYYDNPSTKRNRENSDHSQKGGRNYQNRFRNNNSVDGKITSLISSVSQLNAHGPVTSSQESINSVLELSSANQNTVNTVTSETNNTELNNS